MDHRQKMVVVPQQSRVKVEDDDDDDEDVEALRLAALKSLRTKDATHKRSALTQMQKVPPQITQSSRFSYKNQRPIKKNYYYNRVQQRQNGNVYYQSPRNPNLIAIVPVDEPSPLQQAQLTCPIEKTEPHIDSCPEEVSKFHRFKDSGSASEEEDVKEQKSIATSVKTEVTAKEEVAEFSVKENQEETAENLQKNSDNQEEDNNDDDDDILLMADLEEEDSLERLMDEMEKEMNDENKLDGKREKKLQKGEAKDTKMKDNEESKNLNQKTKSDDNCAKKEKNNVPVSSLTTVKNDRRSVSPHITNRINQKRRSLSPRSRSRKKSPRRSPRRSPIRQLKRETSMRYRSPPLSRNSPRSRSPRLSPRKSPNRTSVKKSPPRKLSPRGRSPKLSSRSKSPRPHRSRSPRRSKSPRSPKISRSRSPRLSRSRSPRYSLPLRSPRSKSPRLSPRRLSPRRLRSRSRSPGLSSPRREPSHLRSPKASPRRTPSRLRSPRLSPHRSPWSSPRHSPRLSPRRKRSWSPKWSPKELPRKHGPRSVTPDNRDGYMREPSPIFKITATPEVSKTKAKQKDETYERPTTTEMTKESIDTISDPVLEARKKKFESMRPIDPINANKKIKLSKKHTTNTKAEPSEGMEVQLSGARRANKTVKEYDVQEMDLEVDYEFEECEEVIENTSPGAFANTINTCIDAEPQKKEKEKSSKKKKKRDKELYQVGKLKSELPLSERIGKDKKYKKRKDIIAESDMDAIFEDITMDEEGDLRTELSRRRAERLNRTVPIQSARLLQSAFKGVVNEAVKNNAKANQRHADEKSNQKEVRRVTVLHRALTELHNSEDESTLDSKVPVRLRLGLNKQMQESRESKVTRKATKRQGRKVKHKICL